MHPFRRAIEARDATAVEALLADTVVFRSPVVFKPYSGKTVATAIVHGAMRVFDNFRYTREITDPAGRDHVLIFEAEVSGKKVTGCDFLHLDDDGKIDDLMVMVRPLSAAHALKEAMQDQFPLIEAEIAERSHSEVGHA